MTPHPVCQWDLAPAIKDFYYTEMAHILAPSPQTPPPLAPLYSRLQRLTCPPQTKIFDLPVEVVNGALLHDVARSWKMILGGHGKFLGEKCENPT